MQLILLAITSLFAQGIHAGACPFKGREPKGHEWHPAKPEDSRSPCTGLNVLANHGYLPRDGRNIDLPTLRKAVSLAFNYAPESFDTAFQQAVDFNLTTTGNPLTFHLHDLAKHDLIEFDGSLSRNDFYSGDDNEFDARVWGSVAHSLNLYDTSTEKYVTIEAAARARAKRVADAMRLNPTFNASASQMQGSPGTLALALTTMWDDEADASPKSWFRSFFENERIPYFEGYQVPKTPRDGDTIGAMFQKIVAVEVEGGDVAPQGASKRWNHPGFA